MYSTTRLLSALTLASLLTAPFAHGQLMLTGHTTGSFDDLGSPNTTVVNAADGESASFRTGIPVSGSTQSSIAFTNVNFSNVESGEPIQVGLFNIVNGMTEIGSGQQTAVFNLGLELTGPENLSLAIGSINFHIDHTPNLPALIPDTFAVSFNQPPPVQIQDTLVQFHITVDPLEFPLAENASIRKGDITATFTPVPEPATYAVGGAVLLLSIVAYRRFRGRSGVTGMPAIA
jgi:hypothetical protein